MYTQTNNPDKSVQIKTIDTNTDIWVYETPFTQFATKKAQGWGMKSNWQIQMYLKPTAERVTGSISTDTGMALINTKEGIIIPGIYMNDLETLCYRGVTLDWIVSNQNSLGLSIQELSFSLAYSWLEKDHTYQGGNLGMYLDKISLWYKRHSKVDDFQARQNHGELNNNIHTH